MSATFSSQTIPRLSPCVIVASRSVGVSTRSSDISCTDDRKLARGSITVLFCTYLSALPSRRRLLEGSIAPANASRNNESAGSLFVDAAVIEARNARSLARASALKYFAFSNVDNSGTGARPSRSAIARRAIAPAIVLRSWDMGCSPTSLVVDTNRKNGLASAASTVVECALPARTLSPAEIAVVPLPENGSMIVRCSRTPKPRSSSTASRSSCEYASFILNHRWMGASPFPLAVTSRLYAPLVPTLNRSSSSE